MKSFQPKLLPKHQKGEAVQLRWKEMIMGSDRSGGGRKQQDGDWKHRTPQEHQTAAQEFCFSVLGAGERPTMASNGHWVHG